MGRKITYDPKRDYYVVLGVETSASAGDIRQAYRRAVREAHPDLHPDRADLATEQIKLINEAYTVLRQPVQRREYDLLRWAFVPGIRVYEETDRSQNSGSPHFSSPSFSATDFSQPGYASNRPWWEQAPLGEDFRQYMAGGVVTMPRREVRWLRRVKLGWLENTWLMLVGVWRTPYATRLSVLSTLLSINMALIVYMMINPANGQRLADGVQNWLDDFQPSGAEHEDSASAADTASRIHFNCEGSGIQISLPENNAPEYSLFLVFGTVDHPQMWSYRVRMAYVGVFFTADAIINNWTTLREPPVTQSIPQPPIRVPQVLALVNLHDQPAGYYVIRVEIVPQNQTVLPSCDIVVQRKLASVEKKS